MFKRFRNKGEWQTEFYDVHHTQKETHPDSMRGIENCKRELPGQKSDKCQLDKFYRMYLIIWKNFCWLLACLGKKKCVK